MTLVRNYSSFKINMCKSASVPCSHIVEGDATQTAAIAPLVQYMCGSTYVESFLQLPALHPPLRNKT